jgi:dihydroneopterin aldolase
MHTSATISLQGMEFFAYHGFYDEEQKIGNKYSVDISLQGDVQASATAQDQLRGTINYELLYRLTAEEMQQQSRLLEHVAARILARIFDTFESVSQAEVCVRKHQPPVGGLCAAAAVTLRRTKA